MTERRMIKVSVEVRSGAARFRVSVRAENVRRALGLVVGRCSHGEVRVVFPAEPASFLARRSAAPAGTAGSEPAYRTAA
jgi:hypothetical protein